MAAIQRLWDEIVAGEIYNSDGGMSAVDVWAKHVVITLGSSVKLDWTPTSCTINGTIMLVAPLEVIPPHLYLAKPAPQAQAFMSPVILDNNPLFKMVPV